MQITGNKVVLNLTGADNMRHVEAGDFVSHLRSFQGGLEYAGITGKVSAAYTVLQPKAAIDSRFFCYVFKSALYVQALQTTTDQLRDGQSIRYPQFSQIPLPQPSLDEQRAIADYLDRETAQIDAFIAKNEELIALLTERRAAAAQSEVEHHVGGGARLKTRLREIDVRAGSSWEKLPLLSVSIHHGVVPREEDHESANDSSDLSHYKVAKLGDLVLNRMRAFQGGLGVAPCEGLVSPDYAVLRPADGVDPAWLALVMRTPRFVGEIAMRLRGIGGTDSGAVRTPRISVADLGAILVSVPSGTLQSAELQAVVTSTERIEKALMVAQRSIALARERRAALISAAVTGKIDVGEAS
ncbi:restriction endonuclease subunit S [Microbacterium istanbulense]|uniref:Restriction endonuclease subunit S n=1 Tax=Microbacterium istanbulense TaxID=3122049 RepID=A0ABU8LLT1_9MICO